MDITERVERLERAVRHLSYALAAVAFLAGALAARAFIPRPLDEIQVRRLALVDREGRERAILLMDGGSPRLLLLYDEEDLPQARSLGSRIRRAGRSGIDPESTSVITSRRSAVSGQGHIPCNAFPQPECPFEQS